MAKETLFRILLRQPWWVTLLVALAMFGAAQAIFPPVAPFMALPFAGLAVYIAFRQWTGKSPVDADERLASLRGMSWEEFSALVADAYGRRGYGVTPAERPGYDFTLTKGGRITLLHCRRWRVNQVGVGPVRDLARAVQREEVSNGICISAGTFSAPAQKLVATEPVTLLFGTELVELVRPGSKKDSAAY
ncbi:MAG TPA: restriction endonuclease [Burkholderiales bacterium]|nr:restriction endonuclease [Burkholderiales bacterium]